MITNSIIAYGDNLGAQMTTYANMIYISKENNQQIVFYDELSQFRRGIQFYKYFDLKLSKLIKYNNSTYNERIAKYSKQFLFESWEDWNKRIYKAKIENVKDRIVHKYICKKHNKFIIINNLKNGVNCDPALLQLNPNCDYDIRNGFGTYKKSWKKYEKQIIEEFTFKTDVIKQAREKYGQVLNNKKTVSVHMRKTDYLIMSSLNLSSNYYIEALSYFDKDQYKLLIFSDDLNACDMSIFNGYDRELIRGNMPIVDMCIMSFCDNNIIANSSFSFWGAMLNKNENKKVICPYCWIGESDKNNIYINGNYYPDEWTSIMTN